MHRYDFHNISSTVIHHTCTFVHPSAPLSITSAPLSIRYRSPAALGLRWFGRLAAGFRGRLGPSSSSSSSLFLCIPFCYCHTIGGSGRGSGEGEEKGALPPWRLAARAPWPMGAILVVIILTRLFEQSVPPSLHTQYGATSSDAKVVEDLYVLDQSAKLQPYLRKHALKRDEII